MLENTTLTEGRFVSRRDVVEDTKVAVLGGTIVEELFKGESPIGMYILIGGVQFRVVGAFDDPASRWRTKWHTCLLPLLRKFLGLTIR